MRVLVISEHYLPKKGGSVTYVYNLCRSLGNLGVEVYLVTTSNDMHTPLIWHEVDNFKVYHLDIPQRFRKERYFPFYLFKRISEIIDEVRPEIIHFTFGHFAPVVTKLHPKFKEISILWTVHNLPPAEHSSKIIRDNVINNIFGRFYFKLVDIFARFGLKYYRYDRIVCVSKSTANKLINKGVLRDKIYILPAGVDIEVFKIEKKEKTNHKNIVLTVAGIIEHKGQINIIKAAPKVLETFPDTLFLFIGPVRSRLYFDLLKKTITELGLDQNIIFLSSLSQEDLLSYYNSCDIYLHPSLEEGFCISILEAMATGNPVIGTPVGEIPKFIRESKAGILIPYSSPAEIIRAVIQLLKNKKIREEFGKRGREYVVANYSWEFVAKQTANLYEELIKEKTQK